MLIIHKSLKRNIHNYIYWTNWIIQVYLNHHTAIWLWQAFMHQLKEKKMTTTPFTNFYNKFWRKLTNLIFLAIMGDFNTRDGKNKTHINVETNG
jgi:hypothetical protein